MFFGSVQGGSRRWLNFGFFNLQPSELAKATLALVLAKLLGESRKASLSNQELFIAAILTTIQVLLIMQQPDLGTAADAHPGAVRDCVCGGPPHALRRCRHGGRDIVGARRVEIRAAGLSARACGNVLEPGAGRTGRRATSRFRPASRSVPAACGAKAFNRGRRVSCGFLPVAHNDFIFSVLAEEQGFVGRRRGCQDLYLFVIMRSLDAARLAQDRLGAYLVLGVLATFTFQVIYNITMSAGLAPVKGLTLPLMSYGGSSMIATLARLRPHPQRANEALHQLSTP